MGPGRRLPKYLKENWGAPFILAFMALLIVSATELSAGLSDEANSMAVYAFYALVIGVALQTASYVKYGEGTPEVEVGPEPTPFRWGRRRKVVAMGVVAIIVLAVSVGVLYPQSPLGTILPHQTYPKLSLKLYFATELHEPDGSTVVGVSVNALGGNPPYNYTASWPDGFRQTSSVGAFPRTFQANQTIPQTVDVDVRSSDGQTASLTVSLNSTSK